MDNPVEETEKKSGKTKSLLNTLFKIVLPLALGIVIIYFLFKDINFDDLWRIIMDANWGILALSLIFGLAANTIRGYRWELFIRPLGYKTRISNLIFSMYGTYAINFALPRAGEVWRCGVIAKEEKVPFGKLFGAMLLDRIFDTFTVLFITLFAIMLNADFFLSQLHANQEFFDKIINFLTSPILYGIIIAIVAIIYIIFKFFKENILVKKVKSLVAAITNDLKAIWKMKTKGKLLLYTAGIWTCYYFYFYVTFYAFDFTENLGPAAALVTFVLGSISMGIPSNGGLGPWQAAVIVGLTLYGVDKVSATGFATGVFAVQSVWVILCGLFGIAALSVRNRRSR